MRTQCEQVAATLKMEAIRSSETFVHTISTQRHIPQDGILHSEIYSLNSSSGLKTSISVKLSLACYFPSIGLLLAGQIPTFSWKESSVSNIF
jgi:hypothetical protein